MVTDGLAPEFFRLAHHARDKVYVDLREIDFASPLVSAVDFGRQVRAAVGFQYAVIEMLYAEAEAGHADCLERFELRFPQRARLALERDFFRVAPAHIFVKPLD